MQLRRFLTMFALAAISTVMVPRLEPLYADEDFEETIETEGMFVEMDDSGRRCGDYDGGICGGTTTIKTWTCTEWKVTSLNGTVSLVGKKPLSLEVGATLQCSASTETVRTFTNRWERTGLGEG